MIFGFYIAIRLQKKKHDCIQFKCMPPNRKDSPLTLQESVQQWGEVALLNLPAD